MFVAEDAEMNVLCIFLSKLGKVQRYSLTLTATYLTHFSVKSD